MKYAIELLERKLIDEKRYEWDAPCPAYSESTNKAMIESSRLAKSRIVDLEQALKILKG